MNGGLLDLFARPISSVDQVMRQAKGARLPMPNMLGGPDMPTEDVGEVGPSGAPPRPPAPAGPPARLPMPNMLGGPNMPTENIGEVGAPRPPAPAPAPAQPVPGGNALAAPAPTPQADVAPPRDDREILRQTARALIAKGSPAQRVQGLQMLYEANKPTEAEKDANERKRLSTAVDGANVSDEVRARAKLGVEIGAKPEHLLEVLGFDPKGQGAEKEKKEKLSKLLQEQARTQMTNAQMRKAAATAVGYIDKGSATTGTTGYLASWIPGSEADKLESALGTIKSNVGFDRLQQMREESKTGGALGNVSNTEIHFLQATQGSLAITQDPEILKQNIADIIAGKELMTEMRGLIPALEEGDPDSIKRYIEISGELGAIGADVQSRLNNTEMPKPTGKGAEINAKYGVK